MQNCYLTNEQKKALRQIAKWLDERIVPTTWTFAVSFSTKALMGKNINQEVQTFVQTLDMADLDTFVDCGFFRRKGEYQFSLNTGKITQGVETNSGNDGMRESLTINSIFGEPLNTSQFQCDIFMVMPFRDPFWEIYEDHIKRMVENMKLKITIGSDPFSKHDIMKEIWSLIHNAQLIIADATGRNPNVFYELGLAHALDKPVIIITQNAEDVPFDVRGKRYILYTHTPRGMEKFEDELKHSIQRILDDES